MQKKLQTGECLLRGQTWMDTHHLSFLTLTSVQTVTVTKTVKVFANQKSWSNNPKSLLRTCDAAFKSGDLQEYRKARLNLQKGIKEDKSKYEQCIEEHFNTNNSRGMWQGIKTLTGFKDSLTDTSTRAFLDTLNHLFSRFEQTTSSQRYQWRTISHS